MLLQKLGIISALFIITTSSQKVQNSSGNCFPLNSKRFTSCPPGYVVQPLAKPPLPKNVIERRLFIRKLRNPLIKQSVFCCRIRAREEESDDSEKLLTSTQIQFPNNIRKPTRQNQQQQQQGQGRRRRRRRRRRRKPKTKIGAIINKLGDTVDDFLNTSISYRQYDGWTWTFRPFKILPFSGEEEVFEKYRTRRGRGRRGRNNFTSPRPPPLQNEIDAEDIKDLSPIPPLPIPSPVPRSPSPTPVPPPQKTPIKLVKADETISSPSPLLPSSTTISRYVVSLRRNGVHFCSGVVVDSKHVLTASNCFVSPVPGNAYETVVNVDPDGVTVKAEGIFDEFVVEHICVHNTVPNPTKELNEIAVINLARAVVFTGNFFPARLVWEGKGVDFGRPDNRATFFSHSDNIESAVIKPVAPRVCQRRHRFMLRKEESCLQIGGRHGTLCSKSDFLGGALECPSGLISDKPHVCGIITETSCPPKGTEYRNNPVSKISPVPKWIYPILTSNSYRSCF